MNCELYQTDLKAYCDRELPLFRRLAIHRHLASCAACRNEVRTMEQITQNLQSSESAEPLSSGLRTRILSEAAKQGKPMPSMSPVPPDEGDGSVAKRRLSPTLVGAVCTVFALAALFMMHPWGTTVQMGARSMTNAYAPMQADKQMQLSAPQSRAMAESMSSHGYGGGYVPQGGIDSRSDSNGYKWENQDGDKPDDTPSTVHKPADLSGVASGVNVSSTAATTRVHAVPSASTSENLLSNDTEVDGYKAQPKNPTVVAQVPTGTYYATPPAAQAATPDSAKNEVAAGASPVITNGDTTTNAPAATDKVQQAEGSNSNGYSQALDFSLNRQVHREANITVQLKDPEAASDQVNQMIKEAGGYVANNDLTTDDSGAKSAQMTLKVPVEQFDTILGQLEKMGNVTAKNVTGDDITGKVSDATQAETVLDDEANRAAERLQSLGRHAKWSDVEDARNIRIELAQSRARVQLLHKLAALADITLSLSETPKPTPPAQSGFLDNMKGNGSSAFQSMISTVGALLTLVIWAIAYIPVWGPLAFAGWYALRRKRERSQLSGV